MMASKKVSEIEVKYLSPSFISEEKVSSSSTVLDILVQIWNRDLIAYQEEFVAIYLNRSNRVLGYRWLSKGGASGTVVDPKHLFGVALKINASAIILSHNHPSGSLIPSEADKNLTKRLREGGKLLDITVLDYLIINPQFEYFSFADEGLI